jgi:outer membrane protein assembly factor BamB
MADGSKMFARLDADGDGRIAIGELPECRAKDAFDFFDSNGDGGIALAEFLPVVSTPKGKGENRVVAIAPGGAGDVAESHVRWSYDRGLPYVASPLLHRGRLYMVKAGGVVTCLDPVTGKVLFGRERLDDHSEYYSSPVGVGEHVIVCSSEGALFVLRAADELELVARADLGEPIHATPAVVDGTIYVRSARTLWAFTHQVREGASK